MRGRSRRIGLWGALALAVGIAAVTPRVGAQERPTVVVTDPSARNFKAAVQTFAPGAPAVDTAELRQDIVDALEFSGVFRSLDPAAFLAAKQTASFGAPIQCSDWTPIGADALLEGATSAKAGGLAIDFQVWDLARCQALLRKQYTGASGDVRRIARRIADDVVEAFTGRRGVASTEITWISTRGGSPEVWVMDADGGHARQATHDGAIDGFPNWAPDGNSIVYMSYLFRRSPHLFRLVRGGSLRAGRILEGLDPKVPVYRGVHDPSGQHLAVVASLEGEPEIYVVDVDGSRPRRLTHDAAIDVSPTWSPDGKQLAFVSDRAGTPQVYVMNADGSGVRRLTYDGGYNTAPAWSPDGRWIAYEKQVGGQFDIWLIDPDGRTDVPLVAHPRSDEEPSWSPDGRKIAFQSTRLGRPDVFSIDIDGQNLRRITHTGDNKSPDWGPYAR